MNKSQILILAAAGTVSFMGTFGATWYAKSSQAKSNIPSKFIEDLGSPDGTEQELAVDNQDKFKKTIPNTKGDLVMNMSEKQLKGLIYDVRMKLKEYEQKEGELTRREKQIAMARATLEKDIERLNKLNSQLAVTFSDLKLQEENLKNSMIEVGTVEKNNMQKLALMYDKMDSAQSSIVFIDMIENRQLEMATKIVYYMQDRTAAKVIGEIADSKPQMSSMLTQELKKVKEVK